MSKPLIKEWHGYTFGFSLEGVIDGVRGEVKLFEEGDMLRISTLINGKETPMGTLKAHYEEGQPDAVTFSAYGAGPNIRFKYAGVQVTRQVPLPLLFSTAFYIICAGDVVKAVMIVDNSQ